MKHKIKSVEKAGEHPQQRRPDKPFDGIFYFEKQEKP